MLIISIKTNSLKLKAFTNNNPEYSCFHRQQAPSPLATSKVNADCGNNRCLFSESYPPKQPITVAARSKDGLRALVCWDGGFESQRGQGCLFVVSVVCCQVDVYLSG